MDIYGRLGVAKLINAQGTVTKIGGSLLDPEVIRAMEEASRCFVNVPEFHEKAGRRVAELLDVPAACITCGAAAGIAISAAACMAGTDQGKILQLPETRGMKDECLIIKCHRTLYDQALLLSGIKRVEVGSTSFCSLAMLETAITERTAMFFYTCEAETMRGSVPLPQITALMRNHNVPIVVDAAAELPPATNIRSYLDQGADLVMFSGGKEIRGPQSSGVIVGDRHLVAACHLNGCPNHSIGRTMKIDKETIAGFTKAIELFVSKNYEDIMNTWERMVDTILFSIKDVKYYILKKGYPSEPGVQPAVIPRAYITSPNWSPDQLQQALLEGTPSIQAGIEQHALAINPQCLLENEVPLLIQRLKELARSPPMKQPTPLYTSEKQSI